MLTPRTLRILHFNPWAGAPEDASSYLARLPDCDLSSKVSNPKDSRLIRMARLDCDWYGECTRCFARMEAPDIRFEPAQVFGPGGTLDLLSILRSQGTQVESWLIFTGQHPQMLEPALVQFLSLFRRIGGRVLYYAFDEASRTMPCFNGLAPHLDVLIHDELPLAPVGQSRLRPDSLVRHRSWVANVVPFAAPFHEAPEAKIIFLGSQLGLTPHRQRQIDHLKKHFKDRFIASCDHSVSVDSRYNLNRYKVGLCPEGRKFTTPTMALSHTDRPFWSGCLGQVPVSEDSAGGGRLESLHQADLIRRYAHGDLSSLTQACEEALETGDEERRRIYDHFNRQETVGGVTAEALINWGLHQQRDA